MAGKKKVTRRDFLKAAAGAAAGAIAFPYIVRPCAAGAAGTVAPSDRIALGCIGLGGQGTWNLNGFMRHTDVQVVALCDVNKGSDAYDMLYQFRGSNSAGLAPALERLKSYYAGLSADGASRGCDTYADFRELLARDDIDAVSVCTPDHWHGLISIAAAKAGKDIYCEKPLVNTVAEGRAVCDAVKRYGRVLQTGSHERSNDSTRFAAELVQNGRIGKLHTVRINMPVDTQVETPPQPVKAVPEGFDYDLWLGPTPWVPYTPKRTRFWWRYILEYGGGEMTDRGAHIIDLAQMGMNTDDTGPVEISATGQAPKNGLFNTFDRYEYECVYANGVRMIGQSGGRRGLKFEGTEGSIFIHVHGGRLETEPASLVQEFIGPDEIHLGRSPDHKRNFLDMVKTRGQTVAPAEVGHRTATICHLLNIAMLTGKKLKWDPVKEQIVGDFEANRMLKRPMRSPWHL